MKNQCPYCKKRDCISDIAFTNCEIYGNNYFTVKCEHCNKVLEIILDRKVILYSICKSNKKETDW
jgi:hypothetical protein